MIDRTLLEEKAPDYVACADDTCPLHDHCLRWQVGQVETDAYMLRTYVNSRHRRCGHGDCRYYRDDQPQRVAFGMVDFFREMPHYLELDIKHHIFSVFTRTRFYRMRKGALAITPEMQVAIADICRQHGWTAAPVYDHYELQYVW